MITRRRLVAVLACAVLLVTAGVAGLPAQRLEPLVYDITFPDPASKTFQVAVTVPTAKRASVDLMMAIWSPGFYGLQNYADRVTAFAAKAADGTALEAVKSSPSRWTVTTGGRASFVFTYTVSAPRRARSSSPSTWTVT